jgi:hypothetical protein
VDRNTGTTETNVAMVIEAFKALLGFLRQFFDLSGL